jgi:hypothetical protein
LKFENRIEERRTFYVINRWNIRTTQKKRSDSVEVCAMSILSLLGERQLRVEVDAGTFEKALAYKPVEDWLELRLETKAHYQDLEETTYEVVQYDPGIVRRPWPGSFPKMGEEGLYGSYSRSLVFREENLTILIELRDEEP